MKEIFRTGWFLFVTCAIAAVLLAATEQITAPRIREFQIQSLMAAKKLVLPGAVIFKEIRVKSAETPSNNVSSVAANPLKAFDRPIDIGLDGAGKTLGFVILTAPKGYGGPISLVVGLHPDLSIAGVKIQSMKETPGLGTKLAEGFLDAFLAACKKAGNVVRLRVKKDGGDIDAITAATVSSRAFCAGIREAAEFVRAHRAELADPSVSPSRPASASILDGF